MLWTPSELDLFPDPATDDGQCPNSHKSRSGVKSASLTVEGMVRILSNVSTISHHGDAADQCEGNCKFEGRISERRR